MKRFGMDYPTAVRDVARRTGIVIPERAADAGPDPNAPLLSAAAAAQDWFTRQLQELPEADIARKYLAGRDIALDVAAGLGLGYAPRGRAFLEEMNRLGIGEDVLLGAGLALKRDEGAVIPRFRGRLIFPIHDFRGRAVAFGGRILGEGEPKYLNSPETAVFHKGRTLYNLHRARHEIRKAETAILVEGYFDVIRLVLAGIENVVAPLGTALTSDQAALLRRQAPAVTLLYDSDKAGLRATFRAGDELLRQGVRVRVATMPPGEDPDTIVRSGGAAALEPVLADAVDILERKLQLLAERGWLEGIEHLRSALDRLLPTIRAAADPITRQLYLTRVAERTGVSKEVLEREVALQPRAMEPGAPGPQRPEARPERRAAALGVNAERTILRILMHDPSWIIRARETLSEDLFELPEARELFRALTTAGPGAPAAQLPAGLSHEAELAWIELRRTAGALAGADMDAMFTANSEVLLSRPEWREIQQIGDPGERQRRRTAWRKRYPKAAQARWVQQAVRRGR
jgi:DNA primase